MRCIFKFGGKYVDIHQRIADSLQRRHTKTRSSSAVGAAAASVLLLWLHRLCGTPFQITLALTTVSLVLSAGWKHTFSQLLLMLSCVDLEWHARLYRALRVFMALFEFCYVTFIFINVGRTVFDGIYMMLMSCPPNKPSAVLLMFGQTRLFGVDLVDG